MNQGPGKDDQPGEVPPPDTTAAPADAPADTDAPPADTPAATPAPGGREPPAGSPWEPAKPGQATATRPQAPPPATARPRWPALLVLVCTLVILAAVAAGSWLLHERIEALASRQMELQQRQATLGSDLSGLQKGLAELKPRLETVAGEVKSLAAASPPTPASSPAAGPGADPTLSGQLADLGRRLEELEQRAGALSQQAAGLDRQVAELAASPAGTKMLMARVDQLEGDSLQAKRLAERLRELEAGASLTKDQFGRLTANVLALNQLREALAGSGAYAQPLQSLQALSQDDAEVQAALKTIAPRAASGIPSLEMLRARFPATAAAVKRAEFTVSGEGWWERALSRLTGLVTVRRTGPDAIAAGGTDAALATAEQALQVNDLAGAVNAVAVIEGKGAEAAAPWLEDARSRLAADAVVAELYGRALARLKALKG